MTERHFVVATAGHVDHGKSALVKALTGTDPDRLPEEKAREITIDLGFAHLDLAAADSDAGLLSVSIIDVPGHEDFVRNMIAGLGAIDLALLVVAADDGWMPQTEEHLQILSYLAVPRMVVAVNKTDAANPDNVVEQIRHQLQTTCFATAPIVATSARTHDGLDELKRTLGGALTTAAPQRDIGKARLFVDRVFNLPGVGSVVTGTLSGGSIAAGQPVFIYPGAYRTRARSVQSHRADVGMAQPGMRTGLNLSDVPRMLHRGCVLTVEPFDGSSIIDVVVHRSPRLTNSAPATRPLKSGMNVYFHHGTARVPAVMVFTTDDPLPTGESAIAQLRLGSPIIAFAGDRFVIRDQSEQHTLAGGVILDPNGETRDFRKPSQQDLLRDRAIAPDDVAVAVESEIVRRGVAPLAGLLTNSNFSEAEIRAAVEDLHKRVRVVVRGGVIAASTFWQILYQRATDLVDAAHTANSQAKGIDLTALRASFPELLPQAIDGLIDELCRGGFVRRGSIIGRASHRPKLPVQLEPAAEQIIARLSAKPLDPPSRSQIAVGPNDRQALRFLIEEGVLVEVGADLVMSDEAFAQASKIVIQTIQQTGPATVSQLRERLQTSRRVAVPLLERLDRDRITRRIGDRRTLTEPAPPGDRAGSRSGRIDGKPQL